MAYLGPVVEQEWCACCRDLSSGLAEKEGRSAGTRQRGGFGESGMEPSRWSNSSKLKDPIESGSSLDPVYSGRTGAGWVVCVVELGYAHEFREEL